MSKTTQTIFLAVFFSIGILIGTQLHGCKGAGAYSSKTDTITRFIPRTDTAWQTITVVKSIPYTVWGHDTVLITRIEKINGHDTTFQALYICNSDTVAYADTLRQANEFKAAIFDTLTNNRIIGRSIRWANLAPIEQRDITKTLTLKPTLIKVYLGADAYGGKEGTKINIDLAPAASIVFLDRYMLDVGYYIFNQQVTAGLKVKLSFRK